MISIYNSRDDLGPERYEFIKYQVNELNCPVDNMNETSLWTPIHWAARFGDVETIKLLISRKVKAFTPDYKCLCPIDLAGYFNHEEALKLLVDYSIECYKELTLTAT